MLKLHHNAGKNLQNWIIYHPSFTVLGDILIHYIIYFMYAVKAKKNYVENIKLTFEYDAAGYRLVILKTSQNTTRST